MVLQTSSSTSPIGTPQNKEVVDLRSLEELIADREAVMAAYEKKGYRFFDGGKDYNVNLEKRKDLWERMRLSAHFAEHG